MYSAEQKINEYLETMGLSLSEQWQDLPSPAPGVSMKSGNVIHMGVTLQLIVEVGTNPPPYEFLSIACGVSFVPRTNVAPLFRTLLSRSASMGGAFFYLDEGSNSIWYKSARYLPGLDLAEFKQMMDHMATLYWPIVNPIIQQFQLPMEPV
jgi:hypothetical protein